MGVGSVEPDFALQAFGDDAADVEAQAAALCKGVELAEALKDGLCLLGRYAATGIGDGEGEVAGLLREGEVEADFTLLGEFLGIGQEVDEYLFDAQAVTLDGVVVVHLGGEA